MPITSESTPFTDVELIPTVTPPAPRETERIKPAQEESVPLSLLEVQMQPSIDNRLGSSYITEPQVTQTENVSCNNSISSSDSITQEYLMNPFNKWLNNMFITHSRVI